MSNYDIRDLHKAMLIITDEIDRICRKHNINYSMYGGTLIGAVRHKGFIPWDDDFDIAMLRTDYERFIDICKNELNTKFDIVSMDNSSDYGYNFIKITLKGTKVLQGDYSKLKDKYSQIWVDVFPMDNVPNDRMKKALHKFRNYICIKLLEERFDGLRSNEKNKKKIFVYKILGFLNRIIPASFLKQRLKRNSIKYALQNTEFITSLSSCYGYDKEMLPRTIFEEFQDYDFEGRKYRAVKNYDLWLTKVFGDYMKLPPVDKRVTHGFTEVDFGEYKA